MRFPLFLLPLFFLTGCGAVLDSVMMAGVEKATNPTLDRAFVVRTAKGRLDTLLDYQIEGDSLYGHRLDYSPVALAQADVHTFRAVSRRAVERAQAPEAESESPARLRYALPLCLTLGLAIGTTAGYLLPANEPASHPGVAAAGNIMAGMVIGLGLGFAVWLIADWD